MKIWDSVYVSAYFIMLPEAGVIFTTHLKYTDLFRPTKKPTGNDNYFTSAYCTACNRKDLPKSYVT